MTARGGDGPVAILAGSGDLPLLIADRLAARGRDHRILAFRGFASRALRGRAHASVGLLDLQGILACLDRWKPATVTLAGGLSRPGPAALLDAYSAFRNRSEVAEVLARGDDGLLRGAISLLEERGYRVASVRELAPDLLSEARTYGSVSPGEAHLAAISTGLSLLDRVSDFDIGQAAVLSGRRVVAIEGPEGTDRMLSRVRALSRRRLFGNSRRQTVLVKAPKRGQDLRVDLPAIGPRTVTNAAAAGVCGIAVASGGTIILDEARTVAAADRLGLFLLGVPSDAGQATETGPILATAAFR